MWQSQNQNIIQRYIRSRTNAGNAHYHYVRNNLAICLLPKNAEVKIYITKAFSAGTHTSKQLMCTSKFVKSHICQCVCSGFEGKIKHESIGKHVFRKKKHHPKL
jgi:hypothetical protein